MASGFRTSSRTQGSTSAGENARPFRDLWCVVPSYHRVDCLSRGAWKLAGCSYPEGDAGNLNYDLSLASSFASLFLPCCPVRHVFLPFSLIANARRRGQKRSEVTCCYRVLWFAVFAAVVAGRCLWREPSRTAATREEQRRRRREESLHRRCTSSSCPSVFSVHDINGRPGAWVQAGVMSVAVLSSSLFCPPSSLSTSPSPLALPPPSSPLRPPPSSTSASTNSLPCSEAPSWCPLHTRTTKLPLRREL